jgi:hypothetical protein
LNEIGCKFPFRRRGILLRQRIAPALSSDVVDRPQARALAMRKPALALRT